ncbi:MAG: DUF29 domain-containing protein [Pseudomonadota bacterium]
MNVLYEKDFARWLEQQGELLRSKKFDQLDLDNLIEEIECMGGNLRRELRSRIENIIMHLLKCQFQPEHKSGSWLGTLREQRSCLGELLEDNPSLRRLVDEAVSKRFGHAVARAADETGIERKVFPVKCPYSADDVLDPDFVP